MQMEIEWLSNVLESMGQGAVSTLFLLAKKDSTKDKRLYSKVTEILEQKKCSKCDRRIPSTPKCKCLKGKVWTKAKGFAITMSGSKPIRFKWIMPNTRM